MTRTHLIRTKRRCAGRRRGAVALEFAFLAPVLLVILFGMAEAGRLINAKSQLINAAREGARMASLDRHVMVGEGQSTNDKIVADVTNFLEASGLCVDGLEVDIVDADNPETPFDLDNSNNDLKLFTLQIKLPYTSINSMCPEGMADTVVSAEVTFRNARAPSLVE